MSSNFCPSCNAPLATDDINVQQGVGLCRACGTMSRLTAIIEHATANALLAEPPAGCSIDEHGEIIVIHASMRRWMSVVPTLAFGAFWNGIVSVFILQVITGFYNATGTPHPSWFPSMATSGAPANLQDAIMLALFMIPFVVIGSGFIVAILVQLAGQLDVRIHGSDSRVRTSVALLAWTKHFDANKVRRIDSGIAHPIQASNFPWIRIDADRTIRFGMLLPGDRRVWLTAVLKALLLPSENGGG